MEEYLTIEELSHRIKMAPGTIRNLIWKHEFEKNVHYIKPTSRKILFIWQAVEGWLHSDPASAQQHHPIKQKTLINI
jgi:hypothetical protein